MLYFVHFEPNSFPDNMLHIRNAYSKPIRSLFEVHSIFEWKWLVQWVPLKACLRELSDTVFQTLSFRYSLIRFKWTLWWRVLRHSSTISSHFFVRFSICHHLNDFPNSLISVVKMLIAQAISPWNSWVKITHESCVRTSESSRYLWRLIFYFRFLSETLKSLWFISSDLLLTSSC